MRVRERQFLRWLREKITVNKMCMFVSFERQENETIYTRWKIT